MSKVRTQHQYSGDEPERLRHLPSRPMNSLQDIGPNTAYLHQKPNNPFEPGDEVKKKDDPDASVGIVVEVLPPETQIKLYGQEVSGEAVQVVFPSSLDDGPRDWRNIDPALLSSYCNDQDIRVYTYKHKNIEHAQSD